MAALGLDISEVLPRFPAYRVALVVAWDAEISGERSPSLAHAIEAVEAEVGARWADTPLAEIAGLKVWRDAYKAFGVKKTSYRSSVERLIKAIQQGRGLPTVNSLVDCYNGISAKYQLPVGADDLDKVTGPLAFRYGRARDTFFALGTAMEGTAMDSAGSGDPPKADEVVYGDAVKLLCRRWNWYQDTRGATSPTTRHAVLTVQWLGAAGPLEPAVEELCAWLAEHCQADTAWAVAEASRPQVEVSWK
jgi:DNA/RNA-binding domain of Phe-tRNA-synthetase-like protein